MGRGKKKGDNIMNEKIVLNYNLFEGDYGSPDDRVIENKMVTTNKNHKNACHICECDIEIDERSRVEKNVFDGEFMTYRVCQKCCEAISYDYENNCELKIDERYKIGYDKRNIARNVNITKGEGR